MARPRDPEIDRRILRATAELARVDHDAVTIAAVAARAGVSRPTVYRRWPNRAALLFDAHIDAAIAPDIPDLGALRPELLWAIEQLVGNIVAGERTMFAEQLAQMIVDADFATSVLARRWRPERDRVHQIWERARQRGEVRPDIDGRTVFDDLLGICISRILITHEPPSPRELGELVDRILTGVVTREICEDARMHETNFTLTAPDGTELAATRWSGDADATMIVQIAHGMGEHSGRYARLAEALIGAGAVVYANDHRGHGRTAGSPERHGDLGPGGWAGLVSDLGLLGAHATREHPDLPLAVIGHSMGSFALQRYLLDHSADLDAAVLSGSTAVDVVAAGIDPTQEVDLSAFNAPFEPARTEYDWLTRDPDEVDAYVADPMCGFGLDAASAASMIAGSDGVADPDRLGGIRSDLPVLLLSGDADPLAGEGALITLVADRYREAGLHEVAVRLYPGARHEVFNETNRDEITADLIAWLRRVLDR